MDDVFDEDDVQMVSSSTRKFVFGCGNIYLTIDELRSRPLRSFLRRGHSGSQEEAEPCAPTD